MSSADESSDNDEQNGAVNVNRRRRGRLPGRRNKQRNTPRRKKMRLALPTSASAEKKDAINEATQNCSLQQVLQQFGLAKEITNVPSKKKRNDGVGQDTKAFTTMCRITKKLVKALCQQYFSGNADDVYNTVFANAAEDKKRAAQLRTFHKLKRTLKGAWKNSPQFSMQTRVLEATLYKGLPVSSWKEIGLDSQGKVSTAALNDFNTMIAKKKLETLYHPKTTLECWHC